MTVIAISSGKGGVGKTTVTANVGAALATEFGKDVLLVDGNVTGANLGFHFGINYPKKTIADFTAKDIEKIIYKHDSGVKLILGPVNLDSRLDPSQLQEVVDTVADNFDFVLIDSAPSMGREALAAINASHEVILVSAPDIPCVVNTNKTCEIAHKLKKKVEGLVLNQVSKKSYELTRDEVKAICNQLPILATVERSEEISKSIALQTPLVLLKPNHRISQEFKQLAAILGGERYKPESLFERLKDLIGFGKKVGERKEKAVSMHRKKHVVGEVVKELLDVEKLKEELSKEVKTELKESVKQELIARLKKKLRERAGE
jgi:septum site-determining protein MinD